MRLRSNDAGQRIAGRISGWVKNVFSCQLPSKVKPGGAISAKIGVLSSGREPSRSEEHTSELQSLRHLVCRLLLEKNKPTKYNTCGRHTGKRSSRGREQARPGAVALRTRRRAPCTCVSSCREPPLVFFF